MTSFTMYRRYPVVVLILYVSSTLVEGTVVPDITEVKACIGRTVIVPWTSDKAITGIQWRKSDFNQVIMGLTAGVPQVNPAYPGQARLSYISGSLSAGMKIAAYEAADDGEYTVTVTSDTVDTDTATITGITCSDSSLSPQVSFNGAQYGVGAHIVGVNSGSYPVSVSSSINLPIDVSVDGQTACSGASTCTYTATIAADNNTLSITVKYTYVDSGTFSISFTFNIEEKADTGAYYATVIIQPICLILHIIICVVAVKKDNKTLLIAGNAVLGSISFITMLATAISTCPGDDMYCGLHIGLGVVVTGIIIIVTITVCCVRFKISKGPVP